MVRVIQDSAAFVLQQADGSSSAALVHTMCQAEWHAHAIRFGSWASCLSSLRAACGARPARVCRLVSATSRWQLKCCLGPHDMSS